ncbi:MAG: hypothetical protein A3F18_05215 [Legionellales bacterium RIFCSPHIGHO2_12_FULL_37_14]|nr:MAG: hypothetical protein A3F18_05215 [Legionellales bacterium RIFCSPHIGHO2_12_FULL_37_14]
MDFKNKKIWIAATFDTKACEAIYLRDILQRLKLPVVTVDLSTSDSATLHATITAKEVAAYHEGGLSAVFTGDRGKSIGAMGHAFTRFVGERDDIGALIGIGGSGGSAMITKAMRSLPIGLPKIMVSTMAAGDVSAYVGVSDITMMPAVTDISGLNRISRLILSNAAGAIAGAFTQSLQPLPNDDARLAIGLSMFGVTTPCIQHVRHLLDKTYDCLVFHATGVGGQVMENLLDNHLLAGLIDLTTTEVCDFLFGGVLPCTADRFGAVARTRTPYVGSCGALDMINFGSFDSVPPRYKNRQLYVHNSQVTLMRTTPEENAIVGEWIAQRLNQCPGKICMLLPEGGLSALDAPKQPFWDVEANSALFAAIENNLEQTEDRKLIRTPFHINDPAFAELAARCFLDIAVKRPNYVTN